MFCWYGGPGVLYLSFFFFNHPATTEIYTLSLHDALPIFGSNDVRFTFRLVKDTSLASPLASNLDNVDSVTVPDSLTAVAWFHQRTPDEFYKVAAPVVILPEHLLAKTAPAKLQASPFASAPVGSGRFRFATWE